MDLGFFLNSFRPSCAFPFASSFYISVWRSISVCTFSTSLLCIAFVSVVGFDSPFWLGSNMHYDGTIPKSISMRSWSKTVLFETFHINIWNQTFWQTSWTSCTWRIRCVSLMICIPSIVMITYFIVPTTTWDTVWARIVMPSATWVLPSSFFTSKEVPCNKVAVTLASLLVPSITSGGEYVRTILRFMRNIAGDHLSVHVVPAGRFTNRFYTTPKHSWTFSFQNFTVRET